MILLAGTTCLRTDRLREKPEKTASGARRDSACSPIDGCRTLIGRRTMGCRVSGDSLAESARADLRNAAYRFGRMKSWQSTIVWIFRANAVSACALPRLKVLSSGDSVRPKRSGPTQQNRMVRSRPRHTTVNDATGKRLIRGWRSDARLQNRLVSISLRIACSASSETRHSVQPRCATFSLPSNST